MQIALAIPNVSSTVRVRDFLTKPNYYLVANRRNVAYIYDIYMYIIISKETWFGKSMNECHKNPWRPADVATIISGRNPTSVATLIQGFSSRLLISIHENLAKKPEFMKNRFRFSLFQSCFSAFGRCHRWNMHGFFSKEKACEISKTKITPTDFLKREGRWCWWRDAQGFFL